MLIAGIKSPAAVLPSYEMINRIGNALAHLASSAAQMTSGVAGNKDRYLLPEEVLNDAFDAVRMARELSGVTAEVRNALFQFGTILEIESKNFDIETTRWPELLETQEWRRLCVAAQTCLKEIGFSLRDWERANGYD